MSDIAELERRLTAALDRISQSASIAASADAGATNAAQAENAELKSEVERLEGRLSRLTDRLGDAEAENTRLTAIVNKMRAHTDALSDANIHGTNAGDAINEAIASELMDLRAARKADLAQMDEILAELAPALKEA
jgi:predicted nuclease with TOPRIM domain